MSKLAYCEYTTGNLEDSGTEALRIFLPAARGYILHCFIHSVREDYGCDVWRLGPAYHVADDFADAALLTTPRAEWEMAIRLKERPDFIGGVIHGDERMTRVVFRLDGRETVPAALRERTEYSAQRRALPCAPSRRANCWPVCWCAMIPSWRWCSATPSWAWRTW